MGFAVASLTGASFPPFPPEEIRARLRTPPNRRGLSKSASGAPATRQLPQVVRNL